MKSTCINSLYKKEVSRNKLFLLNDDYSKSQILSIVIPTSEHISNISFSIEKSDFAYFINNLFGSFITTKHPFLSRSISVNSNCEDKMAEILSNRRLNKLLLKASLNHKSLKITHCRSHRLKNKINRDEVCLCLFINSNSITNISEIRSLLFLAEYMVRIMHSIKPGSNSQNNKNNVLSNFSRIYSEN